MVSGKAQVLMHCGLDLLKLIEKNPEEHTAPQVSPSTWMYWATLGHDVMHCWKEPFVKIRLEVGQEATQVRNVSVV